MGMERLRREIDPVAIDAARRVSPEAFLRARHGSAVFAHRSGRSISVEGILRCDRARDGHWVSCDWHGGGIGDNLSLVMGETGCRFVEAISHLVGDPMRPVIPAVPVSTPGHPTRPRVPARVSVSEGRAYLTGRGISSDTVTAAEACGAVTYCRGAVIFLGRDHTTPEREIRLAALRYIETRTGPDGKPMNKRDLAGSDKGRFPVFLPGDPDLVAVVEGGVNALAVRDLYMMGSSAAPTVIATGGVGVRHWIVENEPMRAILSSAAHVVIVGENETSRDGSPDPLKQARTDFLRDKLAEAVAEARDGELPESLYPPLGAKDAADWLVGALPEDLEAASLPATNSLRV